MTPDPVYNERLRLCRELHDGTVQDILAALLTLRAMPSAKHDTALLHRDAAILALEQALDGARNLIRGVRSANESCATDGAQVERLPSVINRFVRPVVSVGAIRLRVQVDPDIVLPLAFVNDVGNILREVARNVVRHAAATTLGVTASRAANGIWIDLRDDGVGFATDDASDGFGIAGIAERAALIGGAVLVSSCKGVGTRVRVVVPFAQGSPACRAGPARIAAHPVSDHAFATRLVA